jgi:hypothetical protein
MELRVTPSPHRFFFFKINLISIKNITLHDCPAIVVLLGCGGCTLQAGKKLGDGEYRYMQGERVNESFLNTIYPVKIGNALDLKRPAR